MDQPLLSENAAIKHPSAFHGQEGEFLLPQLSVKLKGPIIVVSKVPRRRIWIAEWSQQRLIDPCRGIFRRGLEPNLLALSMALGVTIGLFPVSGATIVLCAIAAVILRSKCHLPTLILADVAVTPFQLMVPLMRVGELVTGADHATIAPGGFWVPFQNDEPPALMYSMMIHVMIGWCLLAPFSVSFLYVVSLPIFRYSLTKCGFYQARQGPSLW